ncbi:hypothetical protein QN219_32775 [Sinorhizobium sp. 7-81]|uniref:hypothetical protein n=1 Tax=Sinorhizobium sp. 8-89 TaxID=3049089 RepID=UPI0024C36A6B|nr:hypothetical protein [Sinorhizobium sp. 8-89]MDK1494690.1 hypothetical protein [Sinorhizobium sp. 8-89]
MAKAPRIGETIPVGVVDKQNETVGVQKNRAPSPAKQLKQLRADLEALKRAVAQAGYDGVQPSLSRTRAAGRAAGGAITDHPIIFAGVILIAVVALAGMTHRRSEPKSRVDVLVADLMHRLDYMKRLLL